MEIQYWWWLLALALGIAEMLTGTFYLLVLGVACALGGVAAWSGFGGTTQLLVTALCAFAGWALLWRNRARARPAPGTSPGDTMRLDVGQSLRIDDWQEARRTVVRYRGAQWRVELAGDDAAASGLPGDYVITRIENNRLIVAPVR